MAALYGRPADSALWITAGAARIVDRFVVATAVAVRAATAGAAARACKEAPMHTGFHRGRRVVSAIALALAAVLLAGSAPSAAAQGRDFAPVTDAMLQDPDPADWVNWRRTLDGWGYSPLDQIDRGNVHRLQLAWGWSMAAGVNQPTPLVYDGVMYLAGAANVVQAVDAATGDRLWEYRRDLSAAVESVLRPRSRSIAIYGDKVYLNAADAHIVALDARTGEVAWDHEVADNALGYRYTSGPIVANGKVVAGMTGCERFKEDVCFISAHDAETGAELWRTSTIARPGEPGGDTWGDLPLLYRAGADSWIPGSFDSESNLTFWSTSQAKPWASLTRGTDGDALYSNSVLALDADTGELSWYFQFTPAETHDLDDVFESVLIDHDGRRSLFKMGKLGILWELDRDTGAFVAAHDLGYQDVARRRSGDGEGDLPAREDAGEGRRARVLPRFRRHPELARLGLPPRDEGALHPHPPDLRQRRLHRDRAGARRQLLPEHGLAVSGQHRPSRQRALPRPLDRDGDRDRAHPVAPLDDDPPRGRRADDGRRPRGQRRHRPQPRRPRRGERGRTVPHAPARLGVGVPDQLTRSGGGSTWRCRWAGVGPTRSTSSRCRLERPTEWTGHWRRSPQRRFAASGSSTGQDGCAAAPRCGDAGRRPVILAPCVAAARESHRRPARPGGGGSTRPSALIRDRLSGRAGVRGALRRAPAALRS